MYKYIICTKLIILKYTKSTGISRKLGGTYRAEKKAKMCFAEIIEMLLSEMRLRSSPTGSIFGKLERCW